MTHKQKQITWISAGLLLVGLVAAFFAYCPIAQNGSDEQNKFFGYTPQPEETAEFVASLPVPTIRDADPNLFKGDKVDTFLYRALYKAHEAKYGTKWKPYKQGIGDCVSMGWAVGCDTALAVDWSIGKTGEFKIAATESIYGGSRVEARGRSAGGWSDGSYGGAAAKWVNKWGVIYREEIGGHDLRIYSPDRAKNWGNFGNGGKDDNGKLDEIAKWHPIPQVTLARNFDEAAAAIQSGYPVAVCSGRGFSGTRDAAGFARPSGSWAHCILPGTIVCSDVPKNSEDIVVGDLVVTHKGRLRPVSEVMTKHYSGDVIRLRLGGCTDVTATRGHPVLIYRPASSEHWATPSVTATRKGQLQRKEVHEQSQPTWMDISDVKPRDYMLVPEKIEFTDIPTPQWEQNPRCKNVPLPLWPDDDVAFLFGSYIADGDAVADHKIRIVISATDTHLERLLVGFRKIGLNPRVKDYGTYKRITADSSIVANAFREWFGTSSKTKKIPAFLMNGQWSLESLLDGYFHGDGTDIHFGRKRVTTVSPVLAHQVWLIAIHLRKWPTMYSKPGGQPSSYANSSDSVVIEYMDGEPARKTTRYWNGYYCIPVRDSQAFHYEGVVYNYDVEEDDSYIASGVVHHNCMVFLGVRYADRPGLLCVNSWGNWNNGPKWPEDQPDGSFWVDASVATGMLSGGDSFAISGADGFKFRDLDHGAWVDLQPKQDTESETHYALAP